MQTCCANTPFTISFKPIIKTVWMQEQNSTLHRTVGAEHGRNRLVGHVGNSRRFLGAEGSPLRNIKFVAKTSGLGREISCIQWTTTNFPAYFAYFAAPAPFYRRPFKYVAPSATSTPELSRLLFQRGYAPGVYIIVSRQTQFCSLPHQKSDKTDILSEISNPASRIWKDICPFSHCISHPIKKPAYETLYHWQLVTKHRCAIAHHVLPELALKYETSESKE